MKNILLIFLLISFNAQGQRFMGSAASDTLYFDEHYNKVKPEVATIKRIIYGNKRLKGYKFIDFDEDWRMEKSGVTKEIDNFPKGMITYFYKNGIKKEEGYQGQNREGLWREWYQNGQLKEKARYKVKKNDVDKLLINYYDSLGNAQVTNGDGYYKEYYYNDTTGMLFRKGRYEDYFPVGEWEAYQLDGTLYYKEHYDKKGRLLLGVSYDSLGTSYEYEKIEVIPTPAGGMDGFYHFLGRNIKYPESAMKNGVQGKVYVRFYVDSEGNVTEVETIKGINKECDEEAERVIRLLPPWNPGLQRGRPVKVKIVLPINFKLS